MDYIKTMSLGMEVANDVVAFDGHLVLLLENQKLVHPKMAWHYDLGPLYAGSEYARHVRVIEEAIQRSAKDKSGLTQGYTTRTKARLLTELRYGSALKGYFLVTRFGRHAHFSPTDVRLLRSTMTLAMAAMYDPRASALLQRLHLHFLDRRTAIYQAADPNSVLEEYLNKTGCVIHPEIYGASGQSPPDIRVRLNAKLVNVPRTALYVAAYDSTDPTEWTDQKQKLRYNIKVDSGVAARVFSSERPFLRTDLRRIRRQTVKLFRDTASKMCVPIVAGNEACHGTLSVEATQKDAYDRIHLHAFALLAAHAARPLGRALDRELAERRCRDVPVLGEIMRAFPQCATWDEVQSVLMAGMPKLGYHRGLICKVQHRKRVVVGDTYWAGDEEAQTRMANLCKRTRRHFTRNKRDCQVKAVLTRHPQVIYDPRHDPATHRDALRIASLSPFAIIPMLDQQGQVVRTLHVEREDIAPIGEPEIANLQQICQAAMAAGERLAEGVADQAVADAAMKWAQFLQQRFVRETDILRALADFAVRMACSRCRVYRIAGDHQVGVCYAGPRLRRIKDFSRFKLRPGSNRLLSRLRREQKLLVCIAKSGKGPRYRGEFSVEYVWPVCQERRLEKNGVPEWVEVPLFMEQRVVGKVVFDKKDHRLSLADRRFGLEDLRLLSALGRFTSLALERTALERALLHHAGIGACMGVFRHEIRNRIVELESEATAPSLTEHYPPSRMAVRSLIQTVQSVKSGIDRLGDFFKRRFHEVELGGEKTVTISSEVSTALKLLRLPPHLISEIPQAPIRVRVPGNQRPLCLILLQLLQNARRAVKEGGHIAITFVKGRAGKPHVLAIKDTGKGVSRGLARDVNATDFVPSRSSTGVGLQCAKLLAAGQGWTLRLKRRAKPTRFEILIPQ